MTLDDATKQYWKFSQHLAALNNPDDREAFLMFTVAPTIANSTSQHQKRLLGKLMARETQVATG